jgi:hypothetical protein
MAMGMTAPDWNHNKGQQTKSEYWKTQADVLIRPTFSATERNGRRFVSGIENVISTRHDFAKKKGNTTLRNITIPWEGHEVNSRLMLQKIRQTKKEEEQTSLQ